MSKLRCSQLRYDTSIISAKIGQVYINLVLIATLKYSSHHSVGGTMKGPVLLIFCALVASSLCSSCPRASNVGKLFPRENNLSLWSHLCFL